MLQALGRAICVELSTPRLILEPRTSEHAADMFEPLQDDAVYQWISMNRPASVASLQADFLRVESRLSPDGLEAWPCWAVVEATSRLVVGQVDVSIDGSHVCTNFGYYFFRKFWGKGYGTEAVMACADHLKSFGVSQLIATVTSGNVASERVLEKAGFVRHRLLPANDILRGTPVDDWEYLRR